MHHKKTFGLVVLAIIGCLLVSTASMIKFWRFDPTQDTQSMEEATYAGQPTSFWHLLFLEPNPSAQIPPSNSVFRTHPDPAAIPMLLELLQAPEAYVRYKSLCCLALLKAQAAPVVPNLVHSLNDKSWFVREQAANTLAQIGKEAILASPELTKSQQDDVFQVRSAAAVALWKVTQDSQIAVPALSDVLREKDVGKEQLEYRAVAARTLGEIGPSAIESVPALIEALHEPKDKHGILMEAAAAALGSIGPNAVQAVPALEEILNHRSEFVQASAAYSLWQISKSPNALSVLANLADDPDKASTIRHKCAELLQIIEKQRDGKGKGKENGKEKGKE